MYIYIYRVVCTRNEHGHKPNVHHNSVWIPPRMTSELWRMRKEDAISPPFAILRSAHSFKNKVTFSFFSHSNVIFWFCNILCKMFKSAVINLLLFLLRKMIIKASNKTKREREEHYFPAVMPTWKYFLFRSLTKRLKIIKKN